MKSRILIIFALVSIFIVIPIDQSYAITDLIGEAKEKGLPYLTSIQVKDDVLKLDEKSLLVLQVDFRSKNDTSVWIDIKPVIEKQFISYHKSGFSIASGISEPYGGEVKNQHRIQDYVEYDDSIIRLNSNESKKIPVFVKVPAEYLEKFRNEPLPILVGFELVDSNVLEKIPRDLGKLEIKSTSSFEDNDSSYELDEAFCLGGRGMILNDQCQRIGNYDIQTGIPIVNNKEECDKLDGTWYDDRKLCDSKYAPVEYRLQFGYEHNVYDDSEEMKMASEKVYFAEESMGMGSGTSLLNASDFQFSIVIIAIIIGAGSFGGLMIFWNNRK